MLVLGYKKIFKSFDSNVTTFPDLAEYNVIIPDRNDAQNYGNKTQVVINLIYALIIKL